MTPNQFASLLEYIKKNNSWGDGMYDIINIRHRRAIKYVSSNFDSRDGKVYYIKFESVLPCGSAEFVIEKHEDVRKIYEWLDEEV